MCCFYFSDLCLSSLWFFFFFFFNDTATTEIYTLSLHDALPIHAAMDRPSPAPPCRRAGSAWWKRSKMRLNSCGGRSEEHTSELQSRRDLVCRLLLEKKKKKKKRYLPIKKKKKKKKLQTKSKKQ